MKKAEQAAPRQDDDVANFVQSIIQNEMASEKGYYLPFGLAPVDIEKIDTIDQQLAVYNKQRAAQMR